VSVSYPHEVRDPIYAFIRYDSDERRLIDSRPFQRLRHIHQLAMTYLVYPGACHNRFEHSLGVMELATRIFDVATDERNERNVTNDRARELFRFDSRRDDWRRALRMAALCHDLGHLPFSHGPEELLPSGTKHEHITLAHIRSAELRPVWEDLNLNPEHVAKLAVGPKVYDGTLDEREEILAEIITGDAFGADRMDYLLRDSYHAGVVYGHFDHYRLIDSLRILPHTFEGSEALALGIDVGGLHSAESLLLARYFIYSQVYFHPVRKIYDIHLKEFLQAILDGKPLSAEPEQHLEMTDNEVLVEIAQAARSQELPGHNPATRIIHREHFRRVYDWNPTDTQMNPEAGNAIAAALRERYGSDMVRHNRYREENRPNDFPVMTNDGVIESAFEMSTIIERVPVVTVDHVYVVPELKVDAERYIKEHRADIIEDEGVNNGTP
jgi:uncharacterized protein